MEPKTVDHYRWVLENYVLPGISDKEPKEITEQTVRELVEEKRAQGLSANTVYVLPKMIARILSFASAEGLCEAPQWDLGKGRPVRMNPNVILSQAQIQKLSTHLIEEPSPRHLGIYLLLTTGMSVGELLELTWADVSFPLRRIRVLMEAETTPDSRNRYRQIPINEQQRIYLKRMASLPTVYVASGKPEPVSRYALRSSFFLALHELNLPEMPLSDLCRTFAVQSLENGMGYADLSKALGVKNSTSFRAIYRKLVTDRTRERLDREFDASKKVRQAPETKRPPEKDPEIRELEAKVDARKQQLKETLANLEGDLEIIHALRNSDLPAPGAPREGLYRFVEKVLGDDRDGRMLVEYLRYNMRVASMPSRKDVTVQTIRARVGRGFSKLIARLDEIYAVEGYDEMGMFRAMTERILEIAPPEPKKVGRKPKKTLESEFRAAIEALGRLEAERGPRAGVPPEDDESSETK